MDEKLIHLENKCREQLKKQGFIDGDIELQPFLHLRYEGTDCALMCQPTDGVGLPRHGNFECTFLKRYANYIITYQWLYRAFVLFFCTAADTVRVIILLKAYKYLPTEN